ncbi:MAG TPA: CHAT domain-containing protein [Pseudonocardiaceae bacterium]|nr:CHAT domain-containing protein [Pseudonocardiaceae bacterium]
MPAPTAPESVRTRVVELHRTGVDAINKGRPATGARALRGGLRLLGWPLGEGRRAMAVWPELPELTTRLLGALAAAEVAQGNKDRGFALLDSAESLLTQGDPGILAHHRGLLLLMVGEMDEALVVHDRAIGLLRRGSDRLALARTLLNRALLHQTAGRVTAAIADLTWCEQLGRELDLPLLVAKAIHGRGACLLLAGDIPGALRAFDTASRGYAAADGMQAVLAVEKARAMLAAGLHSDAATELDDALARFPGLKMDQEHAEAELTRAHTALTAGDPGEAMAWAVRAERRFRKRGNLTWASVAALTRRRAEFAAGRHPKAVAAHALGLADQLRGLGLHKDADQAGLLAARAYVASGDLAAARPYLGRGSTLATRLQSALAKAEYAAASGDRRGTLAHARAGLAVLAKHRRSLSSLDMRTGTTLLGVDLARAGLTAALAQGRPSVIFRWSERARAQAFRFPPAQPIADRETNDAVAELRQLAHTVRSAELAGERDVAASRRCAELERRIRAKGWQAGGTQEQGDEVAFADVRAGLADADSVMVSFLSAGDRLSALVIAGPHARLVRLGSAAVVTEACARLSGDLDVLCGRRLPRPLELAARASVGEQLDVLTEQLMVPLRPLLRDSDAVFVPTGVLSTLPWSLLPDLRGRPVTVTPSASLWHAAHRATPRPGGPPLLVAGPDLDNSVAEVTRLAEIYPDGTVLSGPDATVDRTLTAIPARTSVHFAAHGHHEPDNVLFSRLDLADGPLMAYDIHQLSDVPEHVVLSSCDVGQSVVRIGDETLGFTAALLYSGSRSVVSSVARVDDHATVGVMAAYHRAVRAGQAPARALADALAGEPLMPLVCFGHG